MAELRTYKIIIGFKTIKDVHDVLTIYERFGWKWKSGLCKPLQFVGWKMMWHYWKNHKGVYLELRDKFDIGFMDEVKGDPVTVDFRDFISSQS